MDHAIDALSYPFVDRLYAVGQKVRVTTGLERGMVFTVKEASGGWYAVTGRAFKSHYPWRSKVSELEPFVPWWKRLRRRFLH